MGFSHSPFALAGTFSLLVLVTVSVTANASSDSAAHPNARVKPQGTTLNEADTIVPLRYSKPRYPNYPRLHGKQGCVDVLFNVAPSGKPVNVRVWTSAPKGVFDYAGREAVKSWRFKTTKNGKRAWIYNVSQRINFDIPGTNQSQFQITQWLCEQPPSHPVLVRPAETQAGESALMASYLGENIAYLPTNKDQNLPSGSVTVQFCVEADGNIGEARVKKISGDPRYGPLAVIFLHLMHFKPLIIGSHGKRACGLVRTIPFVIKQPQPTDTPVICGCPKHPLKIVWLNASETTGPATVSTAVSKQRKPHDTTRLGLCLNAAGEVTKATTLEGGNKRLDSAVMHVLKNFRFFAQRNDSGDPVKSCGWQIWAHGMNATDGGITGNNAR